MAGPAAVPGGELVKALCSGICMAPSLKVSHGDVQDKSGQTQAALLLAPKETL